MDPAIRNVLIRNLLERLDADAESMNPRFASIVTSDERRALHSMYNALASDAKQSEEPITPEEPADDVPEPEGAAKEITPKLVHTTPSLNLSSLKANAQSDTVVCFDFGTAKSKAFAGTVDDEEDPDPRMYELALGQADNDPDGAIYTVHSSVWISDDGLMFAGAEALRQSAGALTNGLPRRRLDSIKQELSLSNAERDLASRLLDREIDPTAAELTYEDALCFYLAYLTDITGLELQNRHGLSRYTRRRFSLPAWQPSQRNWAAKTLDQCLKRAQILADTFSGKWRDGISVGDFKAAAEGSRQYVSRLSQLFDDTVANGGLLEPLAAGSGRVWADRSARNLMLVLDVGAGTTDFSLFWIVQSPNGQFRRAFSVFPSSGAIRMAGDLVDDILVKFILEQTHGYPDETTRKRIESGIRLAGVRHTKEQLFNRGQVEIPLVTDQLVKVSREEFEAYAPMQRFAAELRGAIQAFLTRVDPSWEKATESPLMVLTGGSARLPFISGFAEYSWSIGQKTFSFSKARALPEIIANTFDLDFQREYPQLAVAIGGVLPVINQKTELQTWAGGAPPPGQLERYAVTGAT
jgi:hypothetical protein